MDTLLHHLSGFTGCPALTFQEALPFFSKIKVDKGKRLLTVGQVADTMWFITSGMLRAYYYESDLTGKVGARDSKSRIEITTWIVPASGFLTDISSFLYQKPAYYCIEALEDSELYQLSYQNYKILAAASPEMGHLAHERTFEMMDMRVRICGLRLGEDRLALFEAQYPGVVNRLSVNVLASYLNINPSTLSRIRAKRCRQG